MMWGVALAGFVGGFALGFVIGAVIVAAAWVAESLWDDDIG